MKAAAEVNLKRVTLELGGKSALVIFNDADGKYIFEHPIKSVIFCDNLFGSDS
jgi:acyl-CoA reductase-like NAD-dependent aldehyde dehydrogenase